MEYQAATQRDEPVTIRMRRCRPRGATSARHITLAQKTRQSITRKCNAFGANKGFERHGADAAVATIRIGERGTLSFAVDRSRIPATPLGAAARIRTGYPPWGGRGTTACRNPYFTTYPLPGRPARAPRPALPAIGTPLSIPFDVGATAREALTSWASSIAAGVDPCQLAGTDSRPRVLGSTSSADTLLAVNGALLTPAVPPPGPRRAGASAALGINPSPCSSAVA